MAEPTISLQVNEGTEGVPTWVTIVTAIRWVGPDAIAGDLTDHFIAPATDGVDHFFDNAANPNDGELWHDNVTDVQVAVAGRNANRNVFRALETGATDGTADPPELTAYDDATDAANRTAPTLWLLVGTAGTSNISILRAVETESAAPAGNWATQAHDAVPTDGNELDGDNNVEPASAVLAASGNTRWNLAACAPHDATPGETTFVYSLQYSFT